MYNVFLFVLIISFVAPFFLPDTQASLHSLAVCSPDKLKSLPLLPQMVAETKARPFLLTGFKRSQFIFPLALHGSLNCLVFDGAGSRGDAVLQTQYRLGLIIVDCSGAATVEEAAYIIFVLLCSSCFGSPG